MLEFEIIWTGDRLCSTKNNSQDIGGISGFDDHLSGTSSLAGVIKPQNMLWIQKITQFTVYNLNEKFKGTAHKFWHHFITLMSF